MLAMGMVRPSTLLGEGRVRLIFILFCAAIATTVILTGKLDVGHEIAVSVNKRGEAIFSSLFTFLSVFWAAVLTIWSLLKSRATRYVERLADNVVFKDFMNDLEIRLILAFGVVIFSFTIYIVNPALAIPYDNSTIAIAIWLISYGASVLLLIDSLLTARLVLT